MTAYPLGRWSLQNGRVAASIHTREIPEGEGGGYYLYEYSCGDPRVLIQELAEGTTQDQRRNGKRSTYVVVGYITVPGAVREMANRKQELPVARLIYADMRERFGSVAVWIPYGNDGRPVWFHKEVTGL